MQNQRQLLISKLSSSPDAELIVQRILRYEDQGDDILNMIEASGLTGENLKVLLQGPYLGDLDSMIKHIRLGEAASDLRVALKDGDDRVVPQELSLGAAVLKRIRDVSGFPKSGIVFKDIGPLLRDAALFGRVIDWMAGSIFADVGQVVAVESRGFIFGSAVACKLEAPLNLVRKPGKLPPPVQSKSYSLEYGEDALEIQKGSVIPGKKVVIVDDVLATGGTVRAVRELIESEGGIVVGAVFLLELGFLKPRAILQGLTINSLVELK